MANRSSLTPKQQLFVAEYMKDLNATQAAVRAGYSPKTAEEQGCRLLKNVKVQKAMERNMKRRAVRTEITADKVVGELAHIAFDDISNYLDFNQDKDGNVKVKIKDSKAIDTRSISEISVGKDGSFKFKMYCKDNALVQLGKHLGIFVERGELKISREAEGVADALKTNPELADMAVKLFRQANSKGLN